MQREAIRPDGLMRVLSCMARTVGGYAMLLDSNGQAVRWSPEIRHDLLVAFADEIEKVRNGEAGSITVDHHKQLAVVMSVHGMYSPILIMASEKQAFPQAKELLIDAVRLLWLCWQVEQAKEMAQRLHMADSLAREVVIHLLVMGQHVNAERVAATIGPRLADLIRVYLVECEAGSAVYDTLPAQCIKICDGQAFVVRCPVYTRLVIALVPAASTSDAAHDISIDPQTGADPFDDRFRAFALTRSDVAIGVSQVVSLRDAVAGYEQAFHALAAAKSEAQSYAQFSPRGELATLLAGPGRVWATQLLAPVLEYVPLRAQDPDSEELMVTLGSWLSFYNSATRQLKIHRNTLTARLGRIERLLGCDIHQIRAQALLHLALRILNSPPLPGQSHDQRCNIGDLIDSPAIRLWAERQLAPVLAEKTQQLLTTLRTWLSSNARLGPAARSLGISTPGIRKRLLRLEKILRRSLLEGPSARYDLLLALRIHEGHGFEQQILPSRGTQKRNAAS